MVRADRRRREAPRPAAFLDRDGVLIEDVGYPHRVDQISWIDGAIEATRRLNEANHLAIVVTNQSAVARGICTEQDVRAMHRHMQQVAERNGAHFDAFYYCPYHAESVTARYSHPDHPWRKPNPGMLLAAMADFAIEREASFMVGDRPTDVEAARRAGIVGFLAGRDMPLRSIVEKRLAATGTD
ncbi:MAG TPA: HAD family hydrolase [Allosphingosinicella sp.]|nr:HAD family hydrolase [Allosphingosinicella sp.]